ncbi:MAG: 5'-3' exonuclease, partial [Planctomycetota bacterium]
MSQRFYIIDAHATIHRAYHAIRGLANPDGHPTGAVFGFTKVLLAMVRDHRPDLVAVAADSRGKVFRHEIFEDYKANRPPMPDDLAWQIPKVEAVCEGYGIPVYKVTGYEADDIIGTLARQAAAAGYEVVVVSDDKDVLQLVGGGVRVFAPSKNNKQGKFYDAAEVETDRGVPPEKMIDLMGLT